MQMRFQAIRDIGVVATGLVALLIASLAETGAGIFLGSMSHLIALIPGLLVLVPPTIDMRGNISGALVSRLASSMHLGEFEIDLNEQSVLGDNVRVAIITTISISFALGIIASAVTHFIGIDGLNPLDFTLISVLSGILSGFLLLIFTYILAVASYRYRLDLDLIGAPAVTAAGDIITLPILVVSAIGVLWLPLGVRMMLGGAVLALIIVTAWYTLRRTPRVRSIIRETLLLLIPLAILGVMAGVVYNLDVRPVDEHGSAPDPDPAVHGGLRLHRGDPQFAPGDGAAHGRSSPRPTSPGGRRCRILRSRTSTH
jgi:mgtE-like transporter